MNFRDPQLRTHVERVIAIIHGLPSDQRPVCGLLDAWHWFRLIEGEDSPRVAEAIEHLLSPELRPALRNWYSRQHNANEAACKFREQLSKLSGEKFG